MHSSQRTLTTGLVAPLTTAVGACCLAVPALAAPPGQTSPVFADVSSDVGLATESTWKYGGPTVGDFNSDGRYDFALANHNEVPAPLFWGQPNGNFRKHDEPVARWDAHGIAAGDYDRDGDLDLVVAMGGGNGTNPQPARLMRNDAGVFRDVTEEAGIAQLGARGRSVRWIDVDSDGDLDMLQVNAKQVVGETGPRNLLLRNNGKGAFVLQRSPVFESLEAERVLVIDYNDDGVLDLCAFSPLAILRGNDDFTFTDVTDEVLPPSARRVLFVTAAAECDLDRDGDYDLYLSRGKTYYQIANNSLDFDAKTGRLDLRDEGNEGQDGLTFEADAEVRLVDFFHWKRKVEITLPVYLGAEQRRIEEPVGEVVVDPAEADGFPSDLEQSGWYLGHLGGGRWRLEWKLNGDLAWDIRGSVLGVRCVTPDWTPQDRAVPDILLRNDGGEFTDVSDRLPTETKSNNWGVTHGDFNNDGAEDLFVYRFGKLQQRTSDVLLLNGGDGTLSATTDHGANVLGGASHGDMGAAFDYDLDGATDLLSGDDDQGPWRLYRNTTPRESLGNSLLVRVGYSERGVDPLGAEVTVATADATQRKRVGSAGAVHSQSVLSTLHFGLGSAPEATEVSVRWRDGTTQRLDAVGAGTIIGAGKVAPSGGSLSLSASTSP